MGVDVVEPAEGRARPDSPRGVADFMAWLDGCSTASACMASSCAGAPTERGLRSTTPCTHPSARHGLSSSLLQQARSAGSTLIQPRRPQRRSTSVVALGARPCSRPRTEWPCSGIRGSAGCPPGSHADQAVLPNGLLVFGCSVDCADRPRRGRQINRMPHKYRSCANAENRRRASTQLSGGFGAPSQVGTLPGFVPVQRLSLAAPLHSRADMGTCRKTPSRVHTVSS